MDVQRGHCWRCEVQLEQTIHCPDCKMAEYCSSTCEHRDRVRHRSRECPLFGTRSCNKCNKKGTMKECAGCNIAWYCNRECQSSDWVNHKAFCIKAKEDIKSTAAQIGLLNFRMQKDRQGGSPYYLGNTIAKDFLQLDNNEWSDGSIKKTDLNRDYHILSAGCGDLRNTVLTAASLPARYQGSLYITLNDFDPFVMARNVLFLFMLVRFADTEGIESSLTTIWYSVHITKKEYDLIKTSLDELIQMTPQSLTEVTQGLVKVQGEDLADMSQVWDKWRSLECQRKIQPSINLRKQRKTVFEKFKQQHGEGVKYCYTNYLQSSDVKKQTEEWFDHGLFLLTERKQGTMSFDNPTLTGRGASAAPGYETLVRDWNAPKASPKDFAFEYCIRPDSHPFKVWDCLRVRESETRPYPTHMVMYHNYITNLIQKVKHLIQQRRLYIQVSLANSMDFPSIHKSLKMSNYDRIFTSNIADYIGFKKLLQIFKPLPQLRNGSAVLVTETINWIEFLPQAVCKPGTKEFSQCFVGYCQDTGRDVANLKRKFDIGPQVYLEYFDNAPYFIAYLRAQIMAGGVGVQPLTNVPSFGEVMKYNGLEMRDFHKKLNNLVSFQYRSNNRDMTLISATNRAVEWYIPHTDG
ncbi:uncharacterized protein LOC117296567 isoform X2 [Asterias rubens]|nr:uncharacterized protein LOC117296567 isoform X2 [Asterias rubens]XP_033635462.1 uncharacterized protein LOC117296567 isoform X2 [Asterias rubens]XP_033635463.1 uncharacterized protein LOC117296567 isoform X2 [Asterias rubens]